MKPKIIVISGPGGAGKTTIANKLIEQSNGHIVPVTKYTTRPQRPGETPGKEFDYLSEEQFKSAIQNGEMLEYNFFNTHYYGVPKAPVDQALASGRSPILVIDVHGARSVKNKYPDESLLIFVTAPAEQLHARYIARGQSPAEADERLRIAQTQEIPESRWYDLVIENINGQLEQTVAKISEFISSNSRVE